MSPRGYAVNDLRLQVGESMLNGQGRLDTEGDRPRIVIALTAPIIQLDDFKLVALVPAVDPGKASKVNCAIGRFVATCLSLINVQRSISSVRKKSTDGAF